MKLPSELRAGGKLVTYQQAEVIIAVAAHEKVFKVGPITLAIAALLEISPGRVRRRVEGLVRRGLVVARDIGFHRMLQVTLTARGRAAARVWCGP